MKKKYYYLVPKLEHNGIVEGREGTAERKQCWPDHGVCFRLPLDNSWKLISILSYLREAPWCSHVKSEQKELLCTGVFFLQQTASFLTTWLWFLRKLSWLINLPHAFNYLSMISKCKVMFLGKIFQSLKFATFDYLLKEKKTEKKWSGKTAHLIKVNSYWNSL